MIGKLGKVLTADVGDIVKGAGKVLNADVGDIAKGAGKVLNADVGQIVKGAGRVLNTDLGELLRSQEAEERAADTRNAAATASPATAAPTTTTPSPQNTAAAESAPAPAAPTAGIRLTEELITRNRRDLPQGNSLAVLLPIKVGLYERNGQALSGDIATDPVSAVYNANGDTVVVSLTLCWDADEANQRLSEATGEVNAGYKLAPDRSWLLGINSQGIVLAWVRDCYFFTASAPKGIPPLARFLHAFPY